MSASITFSARAYIGQVTIRRTADGIWTTSLHTSTGANRTYRTLAFNVGAKGQAPRLDPGDAVDGPALWLGSSAIDVPVRLVTKIKDFLEEHANGGAA
jgi:hypothetical protein